MKKANFSVKINAPKDKVWDVLWDNESYKKWTSVFSEGSHAITDWKEGSEVLFLSGNGDGMYSTIARKIPNELMSFEHNGEIKNNKKQPQNDDTKSWSGATENYILKGDGNNTELVVEMDVTEEFENYFKDIFPQALNKVKDLAEK